MRTVDYQINKMIQQIDTIQITGEKLFRITEEKTSRVVLCDIGIYSNDSLIDTKQIIIEGEHYNSLMSDSPDFAPNKPENEYREVDLWHVIDVVRAAIT